MKLDGSHDLLPPARSESVCRRTVSGRTHTITSPLGGLGLPTGSTPSSQRTYPPEHSPGRMLATPMNRATPSDAGIEVDILCGSAGLFEPVIQHHA